MERESLQKGHIAHLYDAEEGLIPVKMDEHYLSEQCYKDLIIRYRLNNSTMPYLRKYCPDIEYKKGMVCFGGADSGIFYMDQFQDIIWKTKPQAKFPTFDLPDYTYMYNELTTCVTVEALEQYIEATNTRIIASRYMVPSYVVKLTRKLTHAKKILMELLRH